MRLKSYLKLKDVTITQAAEELDITRGYLHDILSGRREPGRKLVDRITEWSDGAVTYPDLWAKMRRAG